MSDWSDPMSDPIGDLARALAAYRSAPSPPTPPTPARMATTGVDWSGLPLPPLVRRLLLATRIDVDYSRLLFPRTVATVRAVKMFRWRFTAWIEERTEAVRSR